MVFNRRLLASSVSVACLFFLTVVAVQWVGCAYKVELGGDESDEPAHYVTGLMVRNYVVGLAPAAPMAFATEYYRHYPKVAFGHWPPLYYLVQTAWMIPFGVSRVSLMLLMASIMCLLTMLVFVEVSGVYGRLAGVAAGMLLISLPLMQLFARVVMAEILVALLVLLAVRSFGRYLDAGLMREAAWFGIWSSLAILTKGTAFVLALVPLLSVLMTRRWRLLREPSFWLPVVIVVVSCGPWYALAPGARHERVYEYGELRLRSIPLRTVSTQWLDAMGLAPVLLLLAGLLDRAILMAKGKALPGLWIAGMALLAGFLIFRSSVGAATTLRVLTLCMPVAVLLCVAGCEWFSRPRWIRLVALPLALLALIILNVKNVPPKLSRGYVEVARNVLADGRLSRVPLLVSADASGEGMLIAEVAMHESRPGHVILRGNKALAKQGWMGNNYKSLFTTPGEVENYLEQACVGAVIVDEGGTAPLPHRQLLSAAISGSPQRWEHSFSAGTVRVYRLRE